VIGYYDEYEFCVKGIIEVNTPEGVQVITTSGIKETLIRIDTVNELRRVGRNITSKVKNKIQIARYIPLYLSLFGLNPYF